MAQTRTITLSDTNWRQLDTLLSQIPCSDFIQFCLLNDIFEEGLKACEEKHGIKSH